MKRMVKVIGFIECFSLLLQIKNSSNINVCDVGAKKIIWSVNGRGDIDSAFGTMKLI